MMGDDFKIRLIGENEISSIVAYGDAWGGSVTICGDGSLTVNLKNRKTTVCAFMQRNGVRAFSGKYL